MRDLSEDYGVIFGATGFLGSRVALDLAKLNANLILQGRSLEKLKFLDDQIKKVNKKATFLQADVTSSNFYENILKKISSRFQRLDFILNLVGQFNGLRPLTHFTHKDWDKLIEVNISFYWRIIKELEPLIRKSKNSKIIFITNKNISKGKAYHNIFSISKSATDSMLKVLSKENNKLNINTFLIEIETLNAGMSSSLTGNKKIDENILEKTSSKIIQKCFQS